MAETLPYICDQAEAEDGSTEARPPEAVSQTAATDAVTQRDHPRADIEIRRSLRDRPTAFLRLARGGGLRRSREALNNGQTFRDRGV